MRFKKIAAFDGMKTLDRRAWAIDTPRSAEAVDGTPSPAS
jgi:hypothetical protein